MEELINRLEKLGFYKYEEEPDAIAILKTLSIQENSIWLIDDSYQYNDLAQIEKTEDILVVQGSLWLDDPRPRYRFNKLCIESLYGAGVGDFIRDIRPFFAKNGLILSKIVDYYDEGEEYLVKINGEFYFIYPGKFQSERIPFNKRCHFTALQVLRLINSFLAEIKSPERAYIIQADKKSFDPIYFGFLTQQLYETIQQSSWVVWQDKPQTLESFYSEYFQQKRSH